MHNAKRHLCDCTYPITPNQPFITMLSYRFNCHNKRRQRLYAHYHFQLQLSNQPDQTEMSQQSKPLSILLNQLMTVNKIPDRV
jgi:hypothetical protein